MCQKICVSRVGLPAITAAAFVAAITAVPALAATATAAAATTTAAVAATATAAATTTAVAATTTAAATTTEATTTAATACWTLFFRTSFIDGEVTTSEIFGIEAIDGCRHGLWSVHGHKCKSAWAAALPVDWQENISHSAVLREQVADFVLTGTKGEIPHIHLRIHILSVFEVLFPLSVGQASDAEFVSTIEYEDSPDEVTVAQPSTGDRAHLLVGASENASDYCSSFRPWCPSHWIKAEMSPFPKSVVGMGLRRRICST